LSTIVFSTAGHLRQIKGFQACTSLCRIEIPSSVEIISSNGFDHCTSLNELVFSTASHLRTIDGFQACTSLCRIEIPSSVEQIGDCGFAFCRSLSEIIFSSHSCIRQIFGFRDGPSLRLVDFRPCGHMRVKGGFPHLESFILRSDADLQDSRRFVHVGLRNQCALK
jgi:hypothetical protein